MLDSDFAEIEIENRFGQPIYTVSDDVLDRDTPTVHRDVASRDAGVGKILSLLRRPFQRRHTILMVFTMCLSLVAALLLNA